MKRPKLVRKARVEKYIAHYKPYVGLSDWAHTLTMDMSKEADEVASVIALPYRKTFHMVFAPCCFEGSPNPFLTLENTVLHELLHVALWPLLAACAKEPSEQVEWVVEWLEEPFVDPLARVLAKYLPRPR